MVKQAFAPNARGRCTSITAWFLAGVVLNFFLVLSEAGADDLGAKAATVRLVAVKELHARVDLLATTAISGLEDRFVEVILENTEAHRTPEQSEELLRGCHQQILRDQLQSEIQRLAQHYNQDPNGPYFSKEWLEEQFHTHLDSRVNSAIAANIAMHFSPTFRPARVRAVRTQRARVSTSFYPDISTVAKLDQEGWPAMSVQDVMTGTAKGIEGILSESLLFEVQREVADLSRAALIDAQEQAQAQHELVATREPLAKVVAAEELSTVLRKFVEESIAQQDEDKRPERVIYPLLPTVKEAIDDRARDLERLRFLQFAEQYRWSIEPEVLRSEITANLVQHKYKSKSLELVIGRYFAEFLDEVLGHHVGNIKNEETQKACLQRLHETLLTKLELNRAACGILGEKLQDTLSSIRSEIVDKQLADFAELSDRSWRLPESLVLELVSAPNSAQDDRTERTLEELLQSVGFEVENGIHFQSLLEESEQRLQERCQELLAEARYAFDGQNRAVMRQEETIIKDIQRSLADCTIEEWVTRFTADVQEAWSREVTTQERASTTDDTQLEKYTVLFDAVRTRIKQIVKAQYELGRDTRLVKAQAQEIRMKEREPPVSQRESVSESKARGERSSATRAPEEIPKLSFKTEGVANGAGHEASGGTDTGPDLGLGPTVGGGNTGAGNGPANGSGLGMPWWLLLLLLLLLLLPVFVALRHFARRFGSYGQGGGFADQPIQPITWSVMVSRPVKDLRAAAAFYLSFEGAQLVTKNSREAIVEIGSAYVRLIHVSDAPSNPPLELSVVVPSVDEAMKRFTDAMGVTPTKDVRDPDGLSIGVRPRSEINQRIEDPRLSPARQEHQPRTLMGQVTQRDKS